MTNPFENVKIPLDVKETIKKILKGIPKISVKDPKERYLRRIKFVEEQVKRYDAFLKSFPFINELHPFYKEVIEILAGDINKFKICLASIKEAVFLTRKISKDYAKLVSKEEDLNKYLREYVGRVASILRKRKRCINFVIEISKQLKELHTIDPNLPTLIIAGPPNAGKSTLVRRISTGKPEVAVYPFTTKDIHVGHIINEFQRIQVIDTPGILDRPMSERNKIELKAINVIKNLNGIIVFLFDASNLSTLSYKEQINLYHEVKGLGKIVVPVINKIDDINKELYDSIKSELQKENYFEISAEKGYGVDKLLNYLLDVLSKQKIN
jgi:nucleolar GTP-binding protein